MACSGVVALTAGHGSVGEAIGGKGVSATRPGIMARRGESRSGIRTKRAIWNMVKSDLLLRKATYNGHANHRLIPFK